MKDMNISVRVYCNSKRNEVVADEGILKVYVAEKPVDHAANKKVLSLLSEYYQTPKSSLRIIKGENFRDKVVEIDRDI